MSYASASCPLQYKSAVVSLASGEWKSEEEFDQLRVASSYSVKDLLAGFVATELFDVRSFALRSRELCFACPL